MLKDVKFSFKLSDTCSIELLDTSTPIIQEFGFGIVHYVSYGLNYIYISLGKYAIRINK